MLRRVEEEREGDFHARIGRGGQRTWWWSKPLLALFAFSLFWDVSMVAAPLMLPPGTVIGLDGTANAVDYAKNWSELPNGYLSAIYTFGDSQCHQKTHRSFVLNGNQLPVCSRLTSIFVFATVGMLVAARLRPENTFTATFLRMFPAALRDRLLPRADDPPDVIERKWNRATLVVFAIIGLFILPVAFDGFRQELANPPYESTNAVRFFTGIWTGSIGGIIVGLLTNNIWFRGMGKQ